jgi:hypothetical protein
MILPAFAPHPDRTPKAGWRIADRCSCWILANFLRQESGLEDFDLVGTDLAVTDLETGSAETQSGLPV